MDRESHRHKFDNRLKNEDQDIKVSRIRTDIADLVLKEVPGIEDGGRKVVGVSKHLCGAATDLAIRSLRTEVLDRKLISGLLIALCCHHRCDWNLFVGKKFLEENGFLQSHFSLLCGLASWATCGSGRPRNQKDSKPGKKYQCR